MLQVIADFTGLNIITSDTVGGNLTLRLKDIPWDQALDIILQTKGLDMRKNGNVVLIAPREELALKEKQQLEAAQQIGELEPLQTEIVPAELRKSVGDPQPHFVEAEPVVAAGSCPSGVPQPWIRARISSFVQDTPSRLEEVRRIIRQIDIPVRQVLIEARIVVASDYVQPLAGRALRSANRLHVRQRPLFGGFYRQPEYAAGGQPGQRFRHADAYHDDAHAF